MLPSQNTPFFSVLSFSLSLSLSLPAEFSFSFWLSGSSICSLAQNKQFVGPLSWSTLQPRVPRSLILLPYPLPPSAWEPALRLLTHDECVCCCFCFSLGLSSPPYFSPPACVYTQKGRLLQYLIGGGAHKTFLRQVFFSPLFGYCCCCFT